jgi:hypothetical protein
VQIGAPTDAATGVVKWSAGQKRYLMHYIYRSGCSARHKFTQAQLPIFTTQHFRAFVGGEYGLTRKTRMERAAKCFYNVKI